MNNEELMGKAVEMALQSTEPLKCGCVIARNGEIIATAFNSQRSDKKATAHDGIKAIAIASEKLGQKDLNGCVAYCTHEPCTMCLSAMIFAKVDAVYFAISLADVSDSHKRIEISAQELVAKAPRPLPSYLALWLMRLREISALSFNAIPTSTQTISGC